jgi:hypothetical protein
MARRRRSGFWGLLSTVYTDIRRTQRAKQARQTAARKRAASAQRYIEREADRPVSRQRPVRTAPKSVREQVREMTSYTPVYPESDEVTAAGWTPDALPDWMSPAYGADTGRTRSFSSHQQEMRRAGACGAKCQDGTPCARRGVCPYHRKNNERP